MGTSGQTPYVVGQWVRGDRFYGRRKELSEILDGHRESLWLLGIRRIGKTSLLRQVEHLARNEPRGYFPMFWDLQGAENGGDLNATFQDALLEIEDALSDLGIAAGEVVQDEPVASIRSLRRGLLDRGLGMLLLCDEAEALIDVQRSEPALLRRMARLMGSEGTRTVIASTIRLLQLSDADPSSSFLDEFAPPLCLRGLEDEEARSLILQKQQTVTVRIPQPDVEQIRTLSGNHPFLIQLLSKRFLELGSMEDARSQVERDPMLSHFFAIDFEALDGDERAVLDLVSREEPISEDALCGELTIESRRLTLISRTLQKLGLLRFGNSGQYSIAVPLLRSWLAQLPREPKEQLDRTEEALVIGEWNVVRELNELRRGDEQVRLEPRAMNLLVHLASREGRVTSKEEILDTVWRGVFVSDSALTRTIADLRKALGDDAKSPRYIETISKRGYRLVAPVSGQAAAGLVPEAIAGGRRDGPRVYLCRGTENHPLVQGEYLIGRDPECFVSIPSTKVSRRHARLIVAASRASIDDLGSRNGTFVNGQRVKSERRLRNGDAIAVGPETLVYREFDPSELTESDLALSGREPGGND